MNFEKVPTYLYKYMPNNRYLLKTLKNHILNVSNLTAFNDPCENCVFIRDKDNPKLINDFFNKFLKMQFALCFGTSKSNFTLWNYYANGFSGVCLKYRTKDIEKSLEAKVGANYCPSHVTYSNTKVDITKQYSSRLKGNTIDNSLSSKIFFRKFKIWSREKEFRFAIGTQKEKNRFNITKITPLEIIIGFRLNIKKQKQIFTFCELNKIKVTIATPDFSSEKIKINFLKREKQEDTV